MRRWGCEAGCALGFTPLPALGHWAVPGAVVVWWLVCLAVADLSVRLLPNALTLPAAVVFPSASAIVGHAAPALLGAACLAGGHLAVHLVSPRAMGAGDVKLAAGIGALCGGVDVSVAVLVALLSALLSALVGAVMLALPERPQSDTVPHGASLCLAAYALLMVVSM